MTRPRIRLDCDAAMAELAAAGSAQTRKTYGRHGVETTMFGVKYGDLERLRKRIGIDHQLALELWGTANHDARVLATKVVDPDALTPPTADGWARECDNYVIVDAVAGMVARSPLARSRSDRWRDRRGDWEAAAGWHIVGCTADDHSIWSAPDLRLLLHQIEAEIHDRPNRTRHSMNGALIMIAMHDLNLRRQAVSTARRIGTVVVDHGKTGCATPDAIAYIEKTAAHRDMMETRRKRA